MLPDTNLLPQLRSGAGRGGGGLTGGSGGGGMAGAGDAGRPATFFQNLWLWARKTPGTLAKIQSLGGRLIGGVGTVDGTGVILHLSEALRLFRKKKKKNMVSTWPTGSHCPSNPSKCKM